MKKLFTLVSLIAFTAAMNAQDPSKWTKGDDVAADLGLKELAADFSGSLGTNEYGRYGVNSMGNVWQGQGLNEYRPADATAQQVYGFYNVSKPVEFYQIVKVPAGAYILKAQAMYRAGSCADSFKNYFNKKKNSFCHMYANLLDDDKTTVTYENEAVIRDIASANQKGERIHTASDWMTDYEYVVTEEGQQVKYYGPSCCEGFGKYFKEGKYNNEKTFILEKDGYVKIGFSKSDYLKEDELAIGLVEIIYNGEVTEEAQKTLAEEECRALYNELDELALTLDNAGFRGLSSTAWSLAGKYDDDITSASSLADYVKIKANIQSSINAFATSKDLVLQIADIFKSCENMLTVSDFSGKDDLKAVVDAQKVLANEEDAEKIGDPVKYYSDIITALSNARASYLYNQEADIRGAKDFTSLVASPWFVNQEYTPIESEAGKGDWHFEIEGYDSNVEQKKYNEYKQGKTDIASDVDISSDRKVNGQWYKYQVYTNGWTSGSELYYIGRLVAYASPWCSGFYNNDSDDPGIEGVAQNIVALPNGYYSVNCLLRTTDATSEWEKHTQFSGAFAKNSSGYMVASAPRNTDKWYQWHSDATTWEDVESSLIEVKDNKLTIGGGASIQYAVTNFRLNYYENPNFPILAKEKDEALRAQIADEYFAGDKKYLTDLLNSVQHPVTDAASYEEAFKKYDEFSIYVLKVKNAMSSYKAVETLADLSGEWVEPAKEIVANYGKADTDTYEKTTELNDMANAYKSLANTYQSLAPYADDSYVAELMAKQQAELKNGVTTVDAINAYIAQYDQPVLLLKMKVAGADKATEANPVNVSVVMKNPTFAEDEQGSADKSGWSIEPSTNEYARGNAELWNKDAFTFSQKVTGLPAGTYVLRAKALYRDGTAPTQALLDEYVAAGGEENWKNHNARLFAKTSDENNQSSYIKAIYNLKAEQLLFTEVAVKRELVEGVLVDKQVKIIGEKPEDEKVGDCEYWDKDGDNHDGTPFAAGVYPFDTQVGNYYYPASMYGFYQACVQYPEAYQNEVSITINEGDVLEVGIIKDNKIANDWVIFDDFELLFKNGENFARMITGVDEITVKNNDGTTYNIAGQVVDGNFKGITIKNGVKVLK